MKWGESRGQEIGKYFKDDQVRVDDEKGGRCECIWALIFSKKIVSPLNWFVSCGEGGEITALWRGIVQLTILSHWHIWNWWNCCCCCFDGCKWFLTYTLLSAIPFFNGCHSTHHYYRIDEISCVNRGGNERKVCAVRVILIGYKCL